MRLTGPVKAPVGSGAPYFKTLTVGEGSIIHSNLVRVPRFPAPDKRCLITRRAAKRLRLETNMKVVQLSRGMLKGKHFPSDSSE